jgi:hypothetical protein
LSAVITATARLVAIVEDAKAQRFRERERHPGLGGVVAQQAVGVGEPGDGQAVLRLGVVDAVAAGEEGTGLRTGVVASPEHLRRHVEGDRVPRPTQQVDRHDRGAAHRVDVGHRVGRRDPAEGVGVVDHGGEEVGGGDDRAPGAIGGRVDAYGGRVVAMLEADQQVASCPAPAQGAEHPLQLTGRHLAGAAAARGVLGEAEDVVGIDGRSRHPANLGAGRSSGQVARVTPEAVLVW